MSDRVGPDDAAGVRGRSVYGLDVRGLDHVAELAGPSDGDGGELIPVRVTRSTGVPPDAYEIDGERSVRSLPEGRCLRLERAAGRATFFGPPLSPDLLAHPYLGPVAVAFNRWAGRDVFHAAAFVAAGRAWILAGPRTAGKSTLTAALAAAGVPILADDLVVTDGTRVYAGPRSVDLRRPWPAGAVTGSVPAVRPSRLGTRWRMALPATSPWWPLGGWFFLHWADRPALEAVGLSQLLGLLAARRNLRQLPSDPTRILSLASRPAWDLRRRRDWAALPDTVDGLLQAAHRAADPRVSTR